MTGRPWMRVLGGTRPGGLPTPPRGTSNRMPLIPGSTASTRMWASRERREARASARCLPGFRRTPYGTPHAALARMRSATRPVREMTARSPILTDPHQNGHTNMTTTSATGALAAVLADALTESGRTLADLTVAEAIELADGLRALAPPCPRPHLSTCASLRPSRPPPTSSSNAPALADHSRPRLPSTSRQSAVRAGMGRRRSLANAERG